VRWSVMEADRYRETHHTVAGSILDAVGRGFLIATAGLVAGLLFGTTNMASLSLWTVGAAAASGVGCMVGSALVKNARSGGCEQETERSQPVAEAAKNIAATLGGEAADVEPEDCRARRRVTASRQHGHGSGRCV
jgi:hypothetical protein